ncbi:MAG: helix-turn-helix transcriptional regulator [Magnetococcales bacterium]|nr:helix-turn-helix transcriptional regulator [Magnetococcales bacterium]
MKRKNKATNPRAVKLRKSAGAWLKRLRLERSLTQRELAEQIKLKYYTFVSQIENGQGRVPADMYEAYAKALGVEKVEFVKQCLRYYDPHTYDALFGPQSRAA